VMGKSFPELKYLEIRLIFSKFQAVPDALLIIRIALLVIKEKLKQYLNKKPKP